MSKQLENATTTIMANRFGTTLGGGRAGEGAEFVIKCGETAASFETSEQQPKCAATGRAGHNQRRNNGGEREANSNQRRNNAKKKRKITGECLNITWRTYAKWGSGERERERQNAKSFLCLNWGLGGHVPSNKQNQRSGGAATSRPRALVCTSTSTQKQVL